MLVEWGAGVWDSKKAMLQLGTERKNPHYNTTAKLYIDDILIQYSELSTEGNTQSNIPGIDFTSVNSTAPPAGAAPFTFYNRARHKIRLEFQAYKFEDGGGVENMKAQLQLFLEFGGSGGFDPEGKLPLPPLAFHLSTRHCS
jgi:hypothetical protein